MCWEWPHDVFPEDMKMTLFVSLSEVQHHVLPSKSNSKGLIHLPDSSWVFHAILFEHYKYTQLLVLESITKSWVFIILN